MSNRLVALALAAALLVSTAKASLYLDTNFQFWQDITDAPADLCTYMKWGLNMVYYSIAPIAAPILYTYVYNFYNGTNTIDIDVNGTTIPFKMSDGLVYFGIISPEHCFFLLINMLPKIIFTLIGFPQCITFTDAEKEICTNLLGGIVTCA